MWTIRTFGHSAGFLKRKRGSVRPPVPRQPPIRLQEVPDRLPFGSVTQLRHMLKVTTRAAQQACFTVINFLIATVTEAMEQQCFECCTEAIREATFSEQYPIYCLKEVWTQAHPYVQGTLLRCNRAERIVSMVLSNGMDVNGNLRPTLTQLKSGINRASLRANIKHRSWLRVRSSQISLTLCTSH
ncbi:hypothetical protein ERJ75_001149600 [Trypanosoma vivax]|nr:hypothetical protein ERJ75_001149600 [Trypanosoma vivax]